MEYAAFVFAIFGLLAYLQSASLKNRVDALERTLGKMKGTEQHTRLASLSDAAQSYIGQRVQIHLREDHQDIDIINWGNTKYGSITILDADEDWILVHIEMKNKSVDKLIRLESVETISVLKD
ncbi:MAG: hypothetical protein IIU06_01470 [Erysipelotrichales bacterium]|nr:hypothetical protein [Erysipelotrichales bacterium]